MFRAEDGRPEDVLRVGLAQMGLTLHAVREHRSFRHVLTHRTLEVTPFEAEVAGTACSSTYADVRWVEEGELDKLGLSTLARKALAGA